MKFGTTSAQQAHDEPASWMSAILHCLNVEIALQHIKPAHRAHVERSFIV